MDRFRKDFQGSTRVVILGNKLLPLTVVDGLANHTAGILSFFS